MCRVLDVSASGYYDWIGRAPSKRSIDDAVLLERHSQRFTLSPTRTYGRPRVRAELAEQGVRVSGKRIARLMRDHAIRGVSRRRGLIVTTRRDERQRPAPDLVKRRVQSLGTEPVVGGGHDLRADRAGFIFLAVVLDVWSRRVVGWAIGEQMTRRARARRR